MHFPLANYPDINNIARVRVTMSRVSGTNGVAGVGICATTGTWTACTAAYPGPPFADAAGPLAMAASVNGTDMVFDSPALAAQVEAMKRLTTYASGFAFTNSNGTIGVGTNSLPQPTMVLTYYP
jgi:hypothetical protein